MVDGLTEATLLQSWEGYNSSLTELSERFVFSIFLLKLLAHWGQCQPVSHPRGTLECAGAGAQFRGLGSIGASNWQFPIRSNPEIGEKW